MEREAYDIAIIGGGPAGYAAAVRAAQLGRKVLLVEAGGLGGTCLHRGCIPTKALLASARLLHAARNGAAFGVSTSAVSFDYARMRARAEESVARLANGVALLLRANMVEVVRGTASFLDAARIRILPEDGGVREVSPAAILVATGSRPALPAVFADSEFAVLPDDFPTLPELPQSVLIAGGGVIGCEFANLLSLLGVAVTLCEARGRLLPAFDPEAASAVARRLREQGVRIFAGTSISAVQDRDAGVSAQIGAETVEADQLLVAVGRTPGTEGLNLAAAGVATSPDGAILADACGRTNLPNVFAAGDCVAGSPLLAHAATAQGVAAAETACGLEVQLDSPIPSTVFTDPEIGAVGLSEVEAAAKGLSIQTGSASLRTNGRAVAEGGTDGFAKWIADARDGRLLGATIVGPHASELISAAVLAIRARLTARDFARTMLPHPTYAETLADAARLCLQKNKP